MSHKVHAPNPTDLGITLCNVSKEGAYLRGAPMLAPVIADPGHRITCGRCRATIALVKHFIGPGNVLKRGWARYVVDDEA